MDAYGKLVNPQTVVFERLLPGPIERVFAFLFEEDKRKLWFTTGAIPTTPGEKFQMTWKHSTYSPNKSVAAGLHEGDGRERSHCDQHPARL